MRTLALMTAVLLTSGSAFAQDGRQAPEDDLVFDNGFVIEGEVQRPEVEVLIQRENLQKGFELELRESFLPRILDALREAPF